MGISYGAEVLDKDGKVVGNINHLVRNSYTGEISKFVVKSESEGKDLFYSTDDVQEATDDTVKLKIAFDEGEV